MYKRIIFYHPPETAQLLFHLVSIPIYNNKRVYNWLAVLLLCLHLRFICGSLRLSILIVHVIGVNRVNFDPPCFLHMVQVVDGAGHGVAVRGVVDGLLAQLDGLLHGHVPAVLAIQHAIRVGGPGAHGEQVVGQPRAVVVHVVQLRARVVPARDHRAHAQAVPAVGVHCVRKQFARSCNGDALLVSKFVQPALHAKISLPETAVSCTSSHGAKQVRIDLDHLLHSSRSNVWTHG
mmetsp:Transcript_2683/g.4499  ORF Transcript_2683/g.4499 Transcript_2683/m.4499 type:complete len:234 (+) Transcript_2683:148-849(+)